MSEPQLEIGVRNDLRNAYRRAHPEKAAAYDKAERDFAQLVSDFQRVFQEDDIIRAELYACAVKDAISEVAIRYNKARQDFTQFIMLRI